MLKYTQLAVFVFFLLVSACSKEQVVETMEEFTDPLPSWEDDSVKYRIIQFVVEVTDPDHENFVPEKDRVATFDNDGNLWSEQPLYFQMIFALDRIKEMAPDHPEWQNQQPYQAVLEDDMSAIMESGEHGILELVMATHAGMTVDEFKQTVRQWMATSRHPRFNQSYNSMIYQPMLELLNYLRDNQFKTYIVSGGGVDFMRAWVEEAYGIPPDQVVGSSGKTELVFEDGTPVVRKLPEIDFIDDKSGKPIGITKYIGKRPIFASGNSDGDLEMLQWTAAGAGPRFLLYLHHTDSVREWAYDRDSHIGRLDKGLDIALEQDWTVIDMAKDWKVIYPFELN